MSAYIYIYIFKLSDKSFIYINLFLIFLAQPKYSSSSGIKTINEIGYDYKYTFFSGGVKGGMCGFKTRSITINEQFNKKEQLYAYTILIVQSSQER